MKYALSFMSNFEMGDRLVEQRLGVYTSWSLCGQWDGHPYLAEGVTTATEDEFAAGERVWVKDHFFRSMTVLNSRS